MPIHDRPDKTDGSFPVASEQTLDEAMEQRKAIKLLLSVMESEDDRHQECDDYLHGKHPMPYLPKEATAEYRLLAERSVTNMMPLVVQNLVQMLFVEGYGEGDEKSELWRAWQYNRLDARQSAIYSGALTYGAAYAVVTPGTKPKGSPFPKVRGVSARKMTAVYLDPANDEFPIWALEHVHGKRYRLYNDEEILTFDLTGSRSDSETHYRIVSTEKHGAPPGVCPVVRYVYALDLEGRYSGEIEKLMRVQDRLNQTAMDRLLVQTFGSYKVRTVTGMEKPESKADATEAKIQMSVDRVLIGDEEGMKFGSLPETALDGFIAAGKRDQETLSSMSAVPSHYLTGELNNLGAEAIAEARASLDAKVDLLKHAFGESDELVFRLMAWYMDLEDDWDDFEAEVVWRDHQNRSMSQMADALGKIASQLGVPVRALWERIPGVSKTTAAGWAKMLEDEELGRIVDEVIANGGGADGDTGGTDPRAPEGSEPGGGDGSSSPEPASPVGGPE